MKTVWRFTSVVVLFAIVSGSVEAGHKLFKRQQMRQKHCIAVPSPLLATGQAEAGRPPFVTYSDVLTPATAQKWYKIQAYTNPSGWGGTDGWNVLKFNGTLGSTNEIWYDSPGDSCEQGDWDLFYVKSNDLGVIQSMNFYIASGARNGVDNWTFTLSVFELDRTTNTWVLNASFGTLDAFAIDVPIPGNDPSNPMFINNASCHYDSSAGRWEGPDTSGGAPPGELCSLSR